MTKVVTLILINQLVAFGFQSADAALMISAGAVGGILLSLIAAVGFVRILGGFLAFLANLAVLIGLFLVFVGAVLLLAFIPVVP